MRVALVSPAWTQGARGNRTTVVRWAELAHGAAVVPVDPQEVETTSERPDVVHGYHALHGGVAAARWAARISRPLVVSLGGTDLWTWRSGAEGWDTIRDVLAAATVVTGAFEEFGRGLPAQGPYITVPRSVAVRGGDPPHRSGGPPRALLPAGLRPVKGVLEAVELAVELQGRGAITSLTIVGSNHDADYADRVRGRLAGHPNLVLARRDESEMTSLYESMDVVWNTSHHEGGSNALLEAWASGCAVFARAVPGNSELLRGAPSAIACLQPLERRAEIEAFHRSLAGADLGARDEMARRARDWVRRHHAPGDEARALRVAWELALSQ